MPNRILHLADMDVDYINFEVLNKAKDCGFTHIQISPVQTDRDIPDWWDRYQSTSFEIGNRIASKKSLTNLGFRCQQVGLGLIADIVTHHTCTDLSKSKLVRYLYDEERNVTNWNDRYENTHFRVGGLPTLNIWDGNVQYFVRNLIYSLKECGVTGIRWDAVKHMALPSEDCSFFENTMLMFPDMFQYGELIFTPRELMERYQEIMIVGTENNNGTDDSKCVLWVESHDSYREGWTTRQSSQEVLNRYYQLLREHPNAHTLFYQRPFDSTWKSIKHF